MATRIERCYTDNIYLIESIPPNDNLPFERVYVIMGHSGHVYNVTINNHPKCTCPDYVQRKNRCKHIYFVLMRIMNIDNYSDKSYTDEELEEMFLNIPPVAKNLMYEGEKPKEEKEVDQKFEKGDICPICLDPLENGKDLDFCRFSCGKTIHKKCFSMWERTKGSICVFCRAQWYSDIYVKNPKKVSKVLKGAAIPSTIVLTGYGAYHGMKAGGKRAEKATKEGNLERLIKKHKINKE